MKNNINIDLWLSRIGLGLIFFYCLAASKFAAYFAQIHLTLRFLPFPIFIGEILLFICLVLFLSVSRDAKLFNRRSIVLLGLYFGWVLVKALINYHYDGPLTLRNAALFYYPIFAVFAYCFYQKANISRKVLMSLALLAAGILFFKVMGDYYWWTYVTLFAIAVWNTKSAKWRWFGWVFLAVIFLLGKEYLYKGSRSHFVGVFGAVVFLIFYFGALFAKRRDYVRLSILIFGFLFFILGFSVFSNRNAVTSVTSLKRMINEYQAWDRLYQAKQGRFVPKKLTVRLYNYKNLRDLFITSPSVTSQPAEAKREGELAAEIKRAGELAAEIQRARAAEIEKAREQAAEIERAREQAAKALKARPKPAVVALTTSQPVATASAISQPKVTVSAVPRPAVIASTTSQPAVIAPVTSQPVVTAPVTSQPAEDEKAREQAAEIEIAREQAVEAQEARELAADNKRIGELEAEIERAREQAAKARKARPKPIVMASVKSQRSEVVSAVPKDNGGVLLPDWLNNMQYSRIREGRTLDTDEGNIVFRLFVWRDMAREFIQEPKAWVGGFSFGHPQRSRSLEVVNMAGGEWSRDGWITPHNLFFHIIYRAGILGLFLIGALFFMIGGLVKDFFNLNSVAGGLLVGVLVYWLVLSSFLVILEFPYNAILFWTLFGITWAYRDGIKGKT